jgi:ATP-binding cassette, subfamily B, bacterial
MSILSKYLNKLSGSLRLLPALRFVWSAAPGWTIAQIALLLLQGFLPLGNLYITKLIIDAIASGITSANRDSLFSHLLWLLGGMALISILSAITTALAEFVSAAQSQRVADFMQARIHAKSIAVDLEYYENPEYFNLLQRAQQEASYRPTRILNNLINLVQETIALLAMLGLLLSFQWTIATVLFLAAIPSVIVKLRFAKIMFDWQYRRTELERKGSYLGWLLTSEPFAKEIRLFNLGEMFSQRFNNIRKALYTEMLRIDGRRTLATAIAQLFTACITFSAYAYIVLQAFKGILKIGDLFLYYEALQRGQAALRGVLGGLSQLYEDNLFLANLNEFLDLQPSLIAPAIPVPVPIPMQKGLVFENVGFQYSHSDRWALRNVSLTLQPGEVIALVGENGSGKTTLTKLLSRLYDPSEGRILLDGQPLSDYDPTDWRRQISVIFQDYVHYNFTARENIWLGNIDVPLTDIPITDIPITDDPILTAAKQSGADRVIRQLHSGYDTVLGKMFEDGEDLSIGQWQKIALARAFLRDSQIIVLDEPTSAMDPKAEYEVFVQFRKLIQNQAAILISHRLSTVRMADRIYVMGNGTILESGTHNDLIALNGTYANLFETQASSYR